MFASEVQRLLQGSESESQTKSAGAFEEPCFNYVFQSIEKRLRSCMELKGPTRSENVMENIAR